MAAEDGPRTQNQRKPTSPLVEEISPKGSPRQATVETVVEEAQQRHQDAEQKRVEDQEALQYWGYLVKDDKCGSDKLNRLLAGIAHFISNNFEGTNDCTDLTPTQLAAFYRAVGGNYDVLFVDTQASSIAFIYKALGCLHSIQPADGSDGHATPTIPALKPRGFVTWQTIQLLLGPEEHVPFLQSAVEQFDIIDPETGAPFPKVLPDGAFPTEPDPAMTKWYDQVHEKLQRDMQSPQARRRLSLSDASASEQSGDERFAADYFRNPMFRDTAGRPTVGRNYSKTHSNHGKSSPRQGITDRGRAVMHSVRHFISPTSSRDHHHLSPPEARRPRRGSFQDRYREQSTEDEDDYEDITPTGHYPPQYKSRPPRPARSRSRETIETDSDSDGVHVSKRPAMGRRTSSQQSRSRERERDRDRDRERERDDGERRRDRDWERDSPRSTTPTSPPLRHRRSHEPAVSPRDYFPPHVFEYDGPRRHSHATHGRPGPYASSEPAGGFAPSTEPSMASRVSKMQHPRTASPRREHFRAGPLPPPPPPFEERGSYNGRPTVRYSKRSVPPSGSGGGGENRPQYERRKRSDEYGEERKDSSRSRSYDPETERLRQSTRYVEGASGRKYTSEYPWRS